MKITEYPEATTLTENDLILIDGENGTQKIPSANIANSLVDLMETNKVVSNLDLKNLPLESFNKNDVMLVEKLDGTKGFYSIGNLLNEVMTSNIKVITIDQVSNSPLTMSISYPPGFTKDNCVILGANIYDYNEDSLEAGMTNGVALVNYQSRLRVVMRDNDIILTAIYTGTHLLCKVVLYKY